LNISQHLINKSLRFIQLKVYKSFLQTDDRGRSERTVKMKRGNDWIISSLVQKKVNQCFVLVSTVDRYLLYFVHVAFFLVVFQLFVARARPILYLSFVRIPLAQSTHL